MSVGRTYFASLDSTSDRGNGRLSSRESWGSWMREWSRGARSVGGEDVPEKGERRDNQLAKNSKVDETSSPDRSDPSRPLESRIRSQSFLSIWEDHDERRD